MNSFARVVVCQRFDIPAECVFDAWLHPAWIDRWMVSPDTRDERIIRLGVEPRAGGRFSFVIDLRSAEIEYSGKYLELDRPNLLVFTWNTHNSRPTGCRVIVEILELGNGCELTLTQVMDAKEPVSTDEAAAFWRKKLTTMAHIFNGTKNLTLNPS